MEVFKSIFLRVSISMCFLLLDFFISIHVYTCLIAHFSENVEV